MNSFKTGDHIAVTFVDGSGEEFRATVQRVLSDEDEGLGPEVQDYIAYWLEIEPEAGEGTLTASYGLDRQYFIGGRRATIRSL